MVKISIWKRMLEQEMPNGQWIAISDNQLSQEQNKSGSVRDQSILIIDFIYI